ncbi:MAG: ATP-dependent acyl-CoA ligase [Actinomycetia bacterium]|nr:ATP-dependent acyl-CoA ligase [Actinomycetes bacterium]MCP4958170.1 ATP-dependent acyl-CoA ligase [Actinomycetes bacterium]
MSDSKSALGPTIDGLLAERARTHTDREFLRFDSGDLTFAEVDDRTSRLAAGLASIGVEPGATVPVLMANGAEFMISLFALSRLGAVACLINTAFKGPALVHAITVTQPRTVLYDATVAANLDEVADALPAGLVHIAVGGRWEELAASSTIAISSTHEAVDPAMVLFTSGTTGPSKGCVLSHRYVLRHAELMSQHLGFLDSDVLYCPFPLFHIDATVLTVAPALVLGATAAIGERFSVSGFWPEARRFQATVFDFMGATLTMLHKAEPSHHDADNSVRLAWGVPVPDEIAGEFEQRFGLHLVELYGSTDAGIPMYHPIDRPRRPGSCGTVIDAYETQLHDQDGFEVGIGEVGELVVRPTEPSIMADGYLGMPEATLMSRRNLWFHTGDRLHRDADGYHYFVGRSADSIRRRGENISAFEVEEVVKLHPDVLDAAAFGVPSELTEEDLMVAVVPRPGRIIEPEVLVEFCTGRAARHMVPRFIDFVDELPRTPTEKVRKDVLRDRGTTPTTWDTQESSRVRPG